MLHKPLILEPLPGVPLRAVRDASSTEFDALARQEGYHALDVEDCRHKREIAKVVERGSYTFIVAKYGRFEQKTGHLSFSDFNIFLKRDGAVTVEETDADILYERLRHRFGESAQKPDAAHLAYALLDEMVDEYLVALDGIGESVSALEALVLKSPTPHVLQRIFRAKRLLIDFRRNAASMREVVSALLHAEQQRGNEQRDIASYYRDLYEHLVRVIEFIETYRDLLSGALDVYLSAVANRTNEVVKVLTVYGTIVLPLIVVTGLYGMNVRLPLQQSQHAFSVIVAISVAFTTMMLVYFRVKKWY